MRRAAGALLLAAGLLALPARADAPAAAPTPASAADVLARVESYWKNLHSYQVPLTFSGSVKVSFFSVPFSMDGTEYYQAPDKQAVHLNNVPSMARGFETSVASMGTPETWPVTYDISIAKTAPRGKHVAYVLVGTPRKPGNVKTLTMYVNAQSFSIESVTLTYNSGATLDIEFHHHNQSLYRLPVSAKINAKFPNYSGSGQIVYGTYQVNVPVPDSVFEKH